MTQSSQLIYQELKQNKLLWAKYYLARHFRIPSPSFHLEMMAAASQSRYLAVAAPRESSKSTLLAFIDPLHDIVFQLERFIVLISNTYSKSVLSLANMKAELRSNAELRASFPGIEIVKDAEGDSVFLHPNGFAVKVLCKGHDQIGSIRGVKFEAWRPSKIIGDDIEDDELVLNTERRQDLKNIFDQALVPAGEKGKCKYRMIGTLLHDDSLMSDLVSPQKYPEYQKLFYQAHIDPDLPTERSLWPEKWSVEELRTLRKTKPLVYAKEYQNDPIAGTNVRFTRKDFRYWRYDPATNSYTMFDQSGSICGMGRISDCRAAIAADLAWKQEREADMTALVAGFLTPQSDTLLWHARADHGVRPDMLAEHLFSLEAKLRVMTGSTVPVGFEKAMLENVTRWLLKREMRARNRFFSTKPLIWDHDKLTRIETRLQPRYNQHVLYHLEGAMGDLEHQLERFPYGSKDDLIDAEQGLIQLLQYPRQPSHKPAADDQFMKLRQTVIDSKRRHPGTRSGQSTRMAGHMPFRESPLG